MPFHVTLDGRKVTVYTNVRPLRWAHTLGLCLGSRIWVAPSYGAVSGPLLAHEFCHVLQWHHEGVWGFLWRYVGGLLRHGYRLHPMEREAYAFALRRGGEPQFRVLGP